MTEYNKCAHNQTIFVNWAINYAYYKVIPYNRVITPGRMRKKSGFLNQDSPVGAYTTIFPRYKYTMIFPFFKRFACMGPVGVYRQWATLHDYTVVSIIYNKILSNLI